MGFQKCLRMIYDVVFLKFWWVPSARNAWWNGVQENRYPKHFRPLMHFGVHGCVLNVGDSPQFKVFYLTGNFETYSHAIYRWQADFGLDRWKLRGSARDVFWCYESVTASGCCCFLIPAWFPKMNVALSPIVLEVRHMTLGKLKLIFTFHDWN